MQVFFFLTSRKFQRLPPRLWFLWCILMSLKDWLVLARINEDSPQNIIPGNLTLGGLFSLRYPAKNGECSDRFSNQGVKCLEAMLYAVDRINADETILPNTTLGVKAFDTCQQDTIALDYALNHFVLGASSNFKNDYSSEVQNPVIGIIGPLGSQEAVYLSKVLKVFQIPLISYGATSPELTDKSEYEYFSRTIPSDVYQAKAIVQILKKFNQTYVSIVYSDDSYGRLGFDNIKKQGLCIAVDGKLSAKYHKEQYQAVINQLINKDSPKLVVLFCHPVVLNPLLTDMYKYRKSFEKMQFVGSETLGETLISKLLRSITAEVIYTRPMSKSVKGFDGYFSNLSAFNNERNPWFKSFYEQTANCSFEEGNNQSMSQVTVCSSNQTLESATRSLDHFSFNLSEQVVDAVYVFAHALHNVEKNSCLNSRSNCKPLEIVSGKQLLRAIRNVSFTSLTGRKVQLNSDGDFVGEYSIYHLQGHTKNSFKHVKIGEWNRRLRISNKSFWRSIFSEESHCSKPCGTEQVQRGIPQKPTCCWRCEDCPPEAYVYNKTTCHVCKKGYIAERSEGNCLKIKPLYYTLDSRVSFSLVIPPLLFSSLGILAIGFTAFVFIRFNNTPLVKASGRELSFLLLIGLFLSYLFPFICILKPSPLKCFLQFVLDSLPITVSYVAIAVKTDRVFRIFDKNHLGNTRPPLTQPRSRILLAIGLISFQVILLMLLIILEFPRKQLIYFSSTEVHLVCKISNIHVLYSHLYNVILIITCTYYGYRTRHIPRNFNEAKYIAFAMYGSWGTIVTFLVVFVVTAERSDEIQTLAIHCYRVTFMSSILLTFFFAPKVYIILFKPEQNINRSNINRKPSIEENQLEVVECRRLEEEGPSTDLKTSKERDSEEIKKTEDVKYSHRSTQTGWLEN